jgi:hypothetical protein
MKDEFVKRGVAGGMRELVGGGGRQVRRQVATRREPVECIATFSPSPGRVAESLR